MDNQLIRNHTKILQPHASLNIDPAGLAAIPASDVAALKAKVEAQDRLVATLLAQLAAKTTAAEDATTALKAVADLLAQREAAIEVLSRDLVDTRAELEAALAENVAAKARAAAREAARPQKEELAIGAAWNNELPRSEQEEAVDVSPEDQRQKRARGTRGSGREKRRRKEEYQAWLLQNPWYTCEWLIRGLIYHYSL